MRKFEYKNLNRTKIFHPGEFPLERAAQTHYIAHFCSVLRETQNLEETTRDGATAFMNICAIPRLRKEYFNLLIAAGVNIRVIDKQWQNALFKAAKSGNLVLVRSLLDAGLNPMQTDCDGEIPLSVALRCGNLSVAECLTGKVKTPLKIIDKQGENLLHKASWGDVVSVAKMLIQAYHFDVETRDDAGHTALHIAAYQGSNRMLKFLVTEAGANFNALDHEGRTPLFSGAYDGNLRTLKFLCENGADLSVKDKKGITAFQYASDSKQFKAAALLKGG